jgi:hypothetical protein
MPGAFQSPVDSRARAPFYSLVQEVDSLFAETAVRLHSKRIKRLLLRIAMQVELALLESAADGRSRLPSECSNIGTPSTH